MKLTLEGIKNRYEWDKNKIKLPEYDVEKVIKETFEHPTWVHFGVGNIFRGMITQIQQQLLNKGLVNTGIIAVDTFDHEVIDEIYKPFDNLILFVGLKPDGNTLCEVISSVTEAIYADYNNKANLQRLNDIFTNPSLQFVSFTITEKGYALKNIHGELLPIIQTDITNGPTKPQHVMSILTALVYQRYLKGAFPIALVSMDNCSHNGEILETAVTYIARQWVINGFVDEGFLTYLEDETKVSFPWSMIDKITPRPARQIKELLVEKGIENMNIITTAKKTFIAPFVNTEIPQYLVIEDKFPNGRCKLEIAGVYFTDQQTVKDAERMKVSTCLNPLHTTLAIFGCLLGFDRISEEMKDDDLRLLIEKIGYQEGLRVVVNPKIIDPTKFIKEVINERFINPFVPDTPQRIATDTSQKIAIRFGETIKAYASNPNLDVNTLIYIPLTIAGWLRYLLAIDDMGQPMELSTDPMLGQLQNELSKIQFGNQTSVQENLKSILANSSIFGIDLYTVGLGDKVTAIFTEMISGPKAVRNTIHKYLTI